MKQINVKLVAILAVSAIVFLVGTKFLHDYQAVKGAGGMLVQAEQAKQEGNYEQAVKLLQGYLSRRPDDVEQYSNLALTMKSALEESRESGRIIDAKLFHRTYGTIELALRKSPDDIALREAGVDFAMQFGRLNDAVVHIEYLMQANGDKFDPELAIKLTQCQLFSGEEDKAVETLSRMVGFDPINRTFDVANAVAPNYVSAYTFLANIYFVRKQRPDIANQVMDRLIMANPDDPAAYVDRASFLRNGDEEQKAQSRRDLAKALELAPDDPKTMLLAGQFALDAKDFSRAKELYDKTLAVDPENTQALLGLSLWAGATRDVDAAVNYLDRAAEAQPNNAAIIMQKANMEIDRGNFDKVDELVERLKALNQPRPFRDFLEGRVHLNKGEWLRAADKLTAARPHLLQERPEWMTPIDSALAMCHENLSQHDLRKDAFQRILMREPDNMMARWGKIEALRSLKQVDAALAEYAVMERQFNVRDNTSGKLLIPHLTLELLQQRDRPEDERDFEEAELLVRRVLQETRLTAAAKASVLAQYYTEIGQKEKAQETLNKAREKDPDNLVLKLSRVGTLATKDIPAARAALDEFQSEHGDMASVRLLRAQMLMAEKEDGYAEKMRALADNASMFPANDRLRMWARIGRMLVAAGDIKGARELWQRVADAQPDNVQIRIGVFELALQETDAAQRNAALNQLSASVGDDSAEMKWARAMEILWGVKRQERPMEDLSEAKGLIDDAINDRPGWEALYRISGELALRRNNTKRALEEFGKAAEMGATNPEVFRNLAVLHFTNQDYAQAREHLDKLPRYMWSRQEQRMDLELLAREGNLPDEISLNEDSEDPSDHLFAGRVLGSAGRLQEADAAYRRAIELAPENPELWGGLFSLYVDNKQLEAAEKVIRTAEMKLSEANAPMFLGTAYRRIGNWEKSESNYQAAMAMQPDNLKIMYALADMYLASKQFDKAKDMLEQMIQDKDQATESGDDGRLDWARRQMAGIVVSSGTYEGYQQAVSLLRENQGDAATMSEDDLIMYSRLAARRQDAYSRNQAIEVMEATAQRRSLSDQERLQLAELYEKQGRWRDCKSEMESLLAKSSNPKLLDPWLNWLVRHDELDTAATWVRKAPENSLAAIRTRAHIDVSRGQPKRAVTTISKLVPEDPAPQNAAQLKLVASLAEELAARDERIHVVAEKLWKTYANIDPKFMVDYARYLGSRDDGNKLVESLTVLDQVRKSGGVLPALRLSNDVLRNDYFAGKPKYGNAVRGWSDQAIQTNPEMSLLYVYRSELEDVLGDRVASEEWLRKFLDLGRGNSKERGIVANNLAFKLALDGKGDEALQLAEEAMRMLGPQNALKDTFGMAHLARKDYPRAIAEFESALEGNPTAAKYYHLALAKWRTDDQTGAAEAMQAAMDLGAMEELMSSPEAEPFEQFLAELRSAGVIIGAPGDSELQAPAGGDESAEPQAAQVPTISR